MKVVWLDRNLFGVRIVIWRRSLGWRPELHRDAYGAVGWRIFICGPLWVEWTQGGRIP